MTIIEIIVGTLSGLSPEAWTGFIILASFALAAFAIYAMLQAVSSGRR